MEDSASDEMVQRQDLVAYFLSSPITKEPEFEIRIKSDQKSIEEYRNLLKQKKIEHRQIGLPVFPPPICLLLDRKSIKDALTALMKWYKEQKYENLEVSIVHPTGLSKIINSDNDLEKIILAI